MRATPRVFVRWEKQTSREVERDKVIDTATADRERQRRSQVVSSGCRKWPVSTLTEAFPPAHTCLSVTRNLNKFSFSKFSCFFLSSIKHVFFYSVSCFIPAVCGCCFSKGHVHTFSLTPVPSDPPLHPVGSGFECAASVGGIPTF